MIFTDGMQLAGFLPSREGKKPDASFGKRDFLHIVTTAIQMLVHGLEPNNFFPPQQFQVTEAGNIAGR